MRKQVEERRLTALGADGLALTVPLLALAFLVFSYPALLISEGAWVPVAGYEVTGSDELGAEVAKWVGDRGAVLMANHGLLTVGKDIRNANFQTPHDLEYGLLAALLGLCHFRKRGKEPLGFFLVHTAWIALIRLRRPSTNALVARVVDRETSRICENRFRSKSPTDCSMPSIRS